MSIVFSLLLLLLLGFSIHACGDGALDHHSINKESDEKLNPDARVSTPSLPNDATRDDNDHVNVKEGGDRRVESGSEGHDLDRGKASESEPVASVRWRVPHRKKGEGEPGFNLDYLPPKTHPPVHN